LYLEDCADVSKAFGKNHDSSHVSFFAVIQEMRKQIHFFPVAKIIHGMVVVL
jgi:hypothetical protein